MIAPLAEHNLLKCSSVVFLLMHNFTPDSSTPKENLNIFTKLISPSNFTHQH